MHPATELILARIESNPEEFRDSVVCRWNNILLDLHATCPEEEWEIVSAKVKAVRLDAVHQAIMQELCAPTEGSKISFHTNYTNTTPNITYRNTTITTEHLDHIVNDIKSFSRRKK